MIRALLQKNNFTKSSRGFLSALVSTTLFIFVIIASFFATPNFAFATINKQINYQGKLTTPSNVAVSDGSYSVRFKLYTVASGGSPIWTEAHCYSTDSGATCTGSGSDARVAVANGLFSTMLGSVTSLVGVNFNQTLYLSVEIGGGGTSASWDGEMSPRKIIGSVPSAFVADTLQGLTPSAFFQASTSNATSSVSTYLSVTQTGTGKIAEFFGTSSQSILSILSNGDIGVGTSSPTHILGLNNTITAGGFVGNGYNLTNLKAAGPLGGLQFNDTIISATDTINQPAINDSGLNVTSFIVSHGSYFHIGDIVQNGTELMQVTNVVSNTITVTRAYNGTPKSQLINGEILNINVLLNQFNTDARLTWDNTNKSLQIGTSTYAVGATLLGIGGNAANGNVGLSLEDGGVKQASMTLDSSGNLNISDFSLTNTINVTAANINLIGGRNTATLDQNGTFNVGDLISGGQITVGGAGGLGSTLTNSSLTLNVDYSITGNVGLIYNTISGDPHIFESGGVPLVQFDASGNISASGTIALAGTGTSTFAGGINLSSGCFAVSNNCLSTTPNYWTSAGGNIYNNTGTKVGIGTNSPTVGGIQVSSGSSFTALPAYGTAALGNINSTTGWNGSGFLFTNTNSGSKAFSMVYNNDIAYFGQIDASTQSTIMTVNSTGLGVGITGAVTPLEGAKSASGANASVLTIRNSASNAVNNQASINFALSNTSGDVNTSISSINTGGANKASALTFNTYNGSATGERLRIDSAGNVGVGTSSPSQLLTVGNNDQFTVTNTGAVTGTGSITVTTTGYNSYLKLTSSGGTTNIWSDGSGNLNLQPAGGSLNLPGVANLTIDRGSGSSNAQLSLIGRNGGTGSTAYLLANYDGALTVASPTGQPVWLNPGGSNAMTLLSNGKVGVGSTSPAALLGVNGSAYFGGNLTATGTINFSKLATSGSNCLTAGSTGQIATTTCGSQTPWTSNIDANTFNLTNLGTLNLGTLMQGGVDNGSFSTVQLDTYLTLGHSASGANGHGVIWYDESNQSLHLWSSGIDTPTIIINGTDDNGMGPNQTLIGMGIGSADGASTLQVGGNIRMSVFGQCDGATSALSTDATGVIYCNTSLSDARLKTNLTPLASSTLSNLLNLTPLTYTWNDAYFKTETGKHSSFNSSSEFYGLLAQQVAQYFPYAVSTTSQECPSGVGTSTVPCLSVDYAKLVPVVIKSVQEMQAEIDALIASSTLVSINGTNTASISNDSILASIQSSLASMVQWVGQKIVATLGVFQDLTIGSHEKPSGVTLFDKVTGNPYCVQISNGQMMNVLGDCQTLESAAAAVLASSTQSQSGGSSGSTSGNSTQDTTILTNSATSTQPVTPTTTPTPLPVVTAPTSTPSAEINTPTPTTVVTVPATPPATPAQDTITSPPTPPAPTAPTDSTSQTTN